jgi:phosphoesterase RecJ-like protein
MCPLLSEQQLALWHQLLAAAHRIVLTCHRGPDGDAIGSTTALASWLRRRYPEADVRVVVPTIFPDFLKWVPGAEDILIYEKHEEEVRPIVEAADLIIMCDHGELKRMASLGDVIRPLLPIGSGEKGKVRCIMIDHHLDPEPDIADLVISHPELSSTCEVLMRVILELDSPPALLTQSEATSLYTGMMTDTGAFTYASNRPEIFELISILLSYGIDKDKIYRNIFFTYSPNRMKLMG